MLTCWELSSQHGFSQLSLDRLRRALLLRYVAATNNQFSILPALAFSLDMFTKTNMSFGVNEILLASVLGSVVFSVFAAQPLVIVGVTGIEAFA